jgi:hypothetical protein
MITVWSAINLPQKGQYSFRLIKALPFGNWSWFKDSENRVGISLEIKNKAFESSFRPTKYFTVSVLSVDGIGNALTVVCQDKEFYEIFEVLCKDLVSSSINSKTLSEAVSLLKSRLVSWSELFRGMRGITR